MFQDINVFKTAYAMATHAGKRQAIVAQNMANADTPGYRGRDIEPFAASYDRDAPRTAMRASRPAHINGIAQGGTEWAEVATQGATDPNGNSVSLEEEMLKAVEVKRQHDRALAIYKTSLNVLRASLGKV
ncbi:FlgB family protein [Lutimaribacter marinistellae]|uniref:FlgB family protein n=1 Tax=Lutimaribacter marinistellae TaxID=1820329 RepID=A0ABV7TD08_9RHOB